MDIKEELLGLPKHWGFVAVQNKRPYQNDWQNNEKLIDTQIYKNGNPIIRQIKKPLSGMTLNYFLIINNWLNYSKNN